MSTHVNSESESNESIYFIENGHVSYEPPPLPVTVKREPNDEDSQSSLFNLDDTIARDPEVVEIDPVTPHVYEFPRTQSHCVAEDMDPVIECSTEGIVRAAPLLLTSKDREIRMGTLPNAPDFDRNIDHVPARPSKQFLHYIEVPTRASIYGKQNTVSNTATEPRQLYVEKVVKGRPPVVIPSPEGQCDRCRLRSWDDCSLAPEATRCWKCTWDKQRCVWTSKSTNKLSADSRGRGKHAVESNKDNEETEDAEPRLSKRHRTVPIEPLAKKKCLNLRSRAIIVVRNNTSHLKGLIAGSLNVEPTEDDVEEVEELEMLGMPRQKEKVGTADSHSEHAWQLTRQLDEQREHVVTVRNFSHAMQDDVRKATSNLMAATARLHSAKVNYAKSLKDLAEAEHQMEFLEEQEAKLQRFS